MILFLFNINFDPSAPRFWDIMHNLDNLISLKIFMQTNTSPDLDHDRYVEKSQSNYFKIKINLINISNS